MDLLPKYCPFCARPMLDPGGKRTKVHSLPLGAASKGLREAEFALRAVMKEQVVSVSADR